MVLGSVFSACGLSKETPSVVKCHAASHGTVPPKPSYPEPSQVKIIQQSNLERVFFLKDWAGDFGLHELSFFHGKGVSLVSATVQHLTFFSHLRQKNLLFISVIKGYHVLDLFFALKSVDLTDCWSMLLKNIKSCLSWDICPPMWNIILVCWSLTSALYKPFCEASEKYLTLNTFFVLLS